ncbi:hypothetical protein [Mycobacterium canetti]|uniref:hypothetical protein n=1 Tax=Mycobacterium canetti TaxID=78331 RepID=UPI0003449BE9|nr:hypothetical protein [Mycobacterium canetti]
MSHNQNPAPQIDPTQVDAIYERLRLLNDQLETFHAVRRIAFDKSLSAETAAAQIRYLYAAFDKKHSDTTEASRP